MVAGQPSKVVQPSDFLASLVESTYYFAEEDTYCFAEGTDCFAEDTYCSAVGIVGKKGSIEVERRCLGTFYKILIEFML